MSKKTEDKGLTEMEILTLEKNVTVGGSTVTVKPYSWADSIRMVKHFGTIFKTLYVHSDDITALISSLEPLPDNADDETRSARRSEQLHALISLLDGLNNTEDVLAALTEMVAASTKLEHDFIQSLPIDEALELGMAVFEINKNFFTSKGPKMRELLKLDAKTGEKPAPTK